MSAEPLERNAGISDEVRRYPTPNARRDERLAELLERRACLLARLEHDAPRGANTGRSPDSI